MTEKVKFINKSQSVFFATLKQRVDEYFKDRGISQYANWQMVLKTIINLSVMVGSYFLIILGQFSVSVMLYLSILLGFFIAFVAVGICHDAIHGAYSKNKKVNSLLGFLFNLIGANAYVWSIMHNIAHHTFTNIDGHDEDIAPVPLLRLSPYQDHWKMHRYQHWYAFLLYGFTTLLWVFVKDYRVFFQRKIGNIDNRHHPKVQYFNLFFFKAAYYFIFLILPIIIINIPWWQVIIGFVIMHFFEGLTLATIFMLAHIVEGVDYPLPDEKGNIENAWAIHQIHTTSDFARDSVWANYFCGGLNFQIEHHLFPRVCHIHYSAISKIVKKTTQDFNLPYLDNKTFANAISSHLRFLKKLGSKEHTFVNPHYS